MNRKGLRIAEVVAILLVVIVGSVLGLNAIERAQMRARETKNQTICAGQLKQWASVLAMYADESKEGLYPPIRTTPTANFVADLSILYPQYMSDLSFVTCPSDVKKPSSIPEIKPLHSDARRKAFAALNQSYFYFGWVFDRVEEVPDQCLAMDKLPPALAATWNKLPDTAPPAVPGRERRVCRQMALTIDRLQGPSDAADADALLDPPDGNLGGSTVHRLRKGVERMLTTDSNAALGDLAKIASGIPVMLDAFAYSPTFCMFVHIPGGSNVLFLDGHVAFHKYPGTSPVNQPVGSLLDMLETIDRCTP